MAVEEHYYVPKPDDSAPSWKVLVFRHFCPHLPSEAALEQLKHRLEALRPGLPERRCRECNSFSVWLCTHCTEGSPARCGRLVNQHMLAHHAEDASHTIVIEARELTVWCFCCERFLGEEQRSRPEREAVRGMQRALLTEQLFQHRQMKDHLATAF